MVEGAGSEAREKEEALRQGLKPAGQQKKKKPRLVRTGLFLSKYLGELSLSEFCGFIEYAFLKEFFEFFLLNQFSNCFELF